MIDLEIFLHIYQEYTKYQIFYLIFEKKTIISFDQTFKIKHNNNFFINWFNW